MAENSGEIPKVEAPVRSANRLEFLGANHTIEIDPQGCRVKELTLGGVSLAWSGERPDGNHGSWHPCLPYFGPYSKDYEGEKPPSHGTARNSKWKEVESEDPNTLSYEWEMGELEGAYKKGLKFTRNFKVTQDGRVVVETVATNGGKEAMPVNPGEHLYINYPAERRSGVQVNKTPTVYYIFKNDGTKTIDLWAGSGTIISSEGERNPMNPYMESNENTARLPGLGILRWTQEGYDKIALWTQTREDDSGEFLCIESVNSPQDLNDESRNLAPGETRSYVLDLVFEKE